MNRVVLCYCIQEYFHTDYNGKILTSENAFFKRSSFLSSLSRLKRLTNNKRGRYIEK